jgi:hypothetical protein
MRFAAWSRSDRSMPAEVDHPSEASLASREENIVGPEVGMQQRGDVGEVDVVFEERFKLGLDHVSQSVMVSR